MHSEKYNAIKAAGYQTRAKAKHIEQNEKGSKYFIGLEKRNTNMNDIIRLNLDDNREVFEKNEILN